MPLWSYIFQNMNPLVLKSRYALQCLYSKCLKLVELISNFLSICSYDELLILNHYYNPSILNLLIFQICNNISMYNDNLTMMLADNCSGQNGNNFKDQEQSKKSRTLQDSCQQYI